MGKTIVPDRACSAGCLLPTSNPAARAARGPYTHALRALASLRAGEIPLVELAIIVALQE